MKKKVEIMARAVATGSEWKAVLMPNGKMCFSMDILSCSLQLNEMERIPQELRLRREVFEHKTENALLKSQLAAANEQNKKMKAKVTSLMEKYGNALK